MKMNAPASSRWDSEVRLLAWLATCVSVFSFLFYLRHGDVLLYGDAIAHINIARRVFDSKTPGLLQLGTVWLPLPHLLMVPFLLSKEMWQRGIGGCPPSIGAHCLGRLGILCLVLLPLPFRPHPTPPGPPRPRPAPAAPVLWFAYNGIVYRNPLEFENGPYSAEAIERRTQTAGNPGHPGSGNTVLAAQYFLKSGEDNVAVNPWLQRAWILLTLAAIIVVTIHRQLKSSSPFSARNWIPFAFLLIPLPFYALSVAYA